MNVDVNCDKGHKLTGAYIQKSTKTGMQRVNNWFYCQECDKFVKVKVSIEV
jgi:hypothetical protein